MVRRPASLGLIQVKRRTAIGVLAITGGKSGRFEMTGRDIGTMLRRLLSQWRDAHAARAGLNELENSDPQLVAEIARELRLSVPELKEAVAKGAGSDQLMARMMVTFGLDAVSLRSDMPTVLRDVEISCSRCNAKGRCNRELDAGTAAQNAPDFCPNVATFEAIARSRP